MTGILPPEQWPDCVKGHPELKGIFVGGCVCRGVGSRFRAKAHAHTANFPNAGWICVLSEKRLVSRELMLHELAHILTNQGHTDRFRVKLVEIGGTLDEVPEMDGSGRIMMGSCQKKPKLLLKSYHRKERRR